MNSLIVATPILPSPAVVLPTVFSYRTDFLALELTNLIDELNDIVDDACAGFSTLKEAESGFRALSDLMWVTNFVHMTNFVSEFIFVRENDHLRLTKLGITQN